MARLNGDGLTINGHDEGLLKTQLESYHFHSTAAEDLLDRAASKIITLSNTDGNPRIDHGVALLFWRVTKNERLHQLDVKELGESALFEVKNLVNEARLGSVPARNFHFLEHGLMKAKIESESTVTIVKILNELKVAPGLTYTPSAWGQKQIAELGGRTGGAAETHVANTPHDSSKTDKFRLLSKYLYAYEKMLQRMPNLNTLRMRLAELVEITHKRSRKTYSKNRAQTKMINEFLIFHNYNVHVSQVFIWIIYAIRSIENSPLWTVTWKDGKTSTDHANFADALVGVNLTPRIFPNTLRVNDIKKRLMDAIENGVQ